MWKSREASCFFYEIDGKRIVFWVWVLISWKNKEESEGKDQLTSQKMNNSKESDAKEIAQSLEDIMNANDWKEKTDKENEEVRLDTDVNEE